jgi:hypothetical protein
MFKSQVKIGDFYVNIGRENQIFIIQQKQLHIEITSTEPFVTLSGPASALESFEKSYLLRRAEEVKESPNGERRK